MEKDNQELVLTHRFGIDGIVYLSAAGKISNDQLLKFSTWADEVKNILRERALLGDDPILVLSDISGVSHFERKPIAVLKDLLSYDGQFPIRSAIVGGNRFAVLVLDSIISLLRRSNVRHFGGKEAALAWLLKAKKE
jgi:hypothetical protein